MRRERRGSGGGWAGGERERLAARVLSLIKTQNSFTHTPSSLLYGHHRAACNSRVNRNPKRSFLTCEI